LEEPTDISFETLLLNYQMDIGFRRDPAHNPALSSECMYAENFALIVPETHAFLQETFKGLQDVKGDRFILSRLHQKTFYVFSLYQIFNHYQFQPDVYIESDFGGIILGLVAKGLYITILPGSYIHSAPPGVRFITLPHQTQLYVTWRKDDRRPLLKNVLQEVRQVAKTFSDKPSPLAGMDYKSPAHYVAGLL
jgi:DNA-binding transcriptional LysR family regulator